MQDNFRELGELVFVDLWIPDSGLGFPDCDFWIPVSGFLVLGLPSLYLPCYVMCHTQ